MRAYYLEVIEDDGENISTKSTNRGFNGLEIIGILEMKIDDVKKQVLGEIKPDIVRKYIEDEKNEVQEMS